MVQRSAEQRRVDEPTIQPELSRVRNVAAGLSRSVKCCLTHVGLLVMMLSMIGRLIDRRRLRLRLQQLARDARIIGDTLLGNTPNPVLRRGFKPRPAIASSSEAHTLVSRRLRVTTVTRETADAVSLALEDVSGAPIRYVAGQFLTLDVPIEGRRHRRAYSISTPPGASDGVQVAVKRVPDGVVSTYLTTQVAAGFEVDAMGPSGLFVRPEGAVSHTVMIGAGSGITPLMAMLRAQLEAPGESGQPLTLLYGNRGLDDVIFRSRLASLAAEHPSRFRFRLVLETPPDQWDGGVGRLDAETIGAELTALGVLDDPEAHYFVCGPGPVLDHAALALSAHEIPAGRVHQERFQSPGEQRVHPVAPQTVRAETLDRSGQAGTARTFVVEPGKTLLEAGIAAGMQMPFSCAMGGCAACKVRVDKGEVAMDEPNCLSPEERAAGYVLACVSRPLSALSITVTS
ncbi:MAG: ring-1,2-phenylacetyl-CoA epoxidase subunit PaaE [Myxococcota bacterium]|jgi:ring-1,2-phenylacetyl-CoA epoxidase subunit PaaE